MHLYNICIAILLLSASTVYTKPFPNDKSFPFNIVIFLAKPDVDVHELASDKSVSLVKFPVKGQVESCRTGRSGAYPDQFVDVLTIDQNKCNCEDILLSSLLSLFQWAQNNMHMTTGVVSSDQFPRQKKEAGVSSSDSNLLVEKQPKYYNKQDKKKNSKKSKKDFDNPMLKYDYLYDESIPIINVFNPENSPYGNSEFFKYEEAIRNSKYADMQMMKHKDQDSKFDTNHVVKKVLKRSVLETPPMLFKEPNDSTDDFDLFRLFSSFRNALTFLGPMVKSTKEENLIDMSRLGTIREPTFFPLVKSTLSAIRNNDQGFLMTILAGKLSDLSDPYSELSQSVKFVLESTDPNNTLTVVTGSCPEKNQEKRKIPFFAKGNTNRENSSHLLRTENLNEIFENIRNMLALQQLETLKRPSKTMGITNNNNEPNLRLLEKIPDDNDGVIRSISNIDGRNDKEILVRFQRSAVSGTRKIMSSVSLIWVSGSLITSLLNILY